MQSDTLPGRGASRRRRIIAGLSLAALVGLVAWLLWQITRPETLAAGDALPRVAYVSEGVTHALATDPAAGVVVVLFRSDCPSCRNELVALEAGAARLTPRRIIMLSEEPAAVVDAYARTWPGLARSGVVQWGAVADGGLKRAFGKQLVPTHFFFGPEGRLAERLTGEAPLRLLRPAPREEVR